MIPIRYDVTLPVHPDEQWPRELPVVPRVGDLMRSTKDWGGSSLVLQVVIVCWCTGYVELTLALPSGVTRRSFACDYSRLTGMSFTTWL